MARTNKQPAFLFYTGDWLKDPQLSLCSPATRGVWMDLLCAMHEASRSGELRGTIEQLARVSRCSTADLSQALTDLQTTGAAGVTERNGVFTVMSRRMMRECKERNQAALRQSRKRRHGISHSGVAPPSSSSVSNKPPPPNKTQFETTPVFQTERRPSAGLAGGGENDWTEERTARCNCALQNCGYVRRDAFIAECQKRGVAPYVLWEACEEYLANKSRFNGPGAIADKIRTGSWPAEGVVTIEVAKKRRAYKNANERTLALEAARKQLIKAGHDDARDWDDNVLIDKANELGLKI